MTSKAGHLIRRLVGSRLPFELKELDEPDAAVSSLFRHSFKADPPQFPRHFVAQFTRASTLRTCGYVHYTVHEPGVYLIGGLCIDSRVYRLITEAERRALAAAGSLSRWLLDHSANALGQKRAVFAYTGDTRSQRDILALGFVAASQPYLFVRWFDEPLPRRQELVDSVARLGPF